MALPAVVADDARPELGLFLRATCPYAPGVAWFKDSSTNKGQLEPMKPAKDLVLCESPLVRVPRLRRLSAEALAAAPKLRKDMDR